MSYDLEKGLRLDEEDQQGEDHPSRFRRWRRERGSSSRQQPQQQQQQQQQYNNVLQAEEPSEGALLDRAQDSQTHKQVCEQHQEQEQEQELPSRGTKKQLDKGKGKAVCTDGWAKETAVEAESTAARQEAEPVRGRTSAMALALARMKLGTRRRRSEEARRRRRPKKVFDVDSEEDDWILVMDDVDVWDFSEEIGPME